MKLNLKNTIKDPGLGYNSSENAQSLINPDGSSNIIHQNKDKDINNLYSYLIDISWSKFFFIVLSSLIGLNLLFAFGYLAIGIEQIAAPSNAIFTDYLNAFFFGIQTTTTVGYGVLAPSGIATNLLATLHAIIGLLAFSFITGLLYGRFSKPNAAVKFSDVVVYRKFEDANALMFRLVNKRRNLMIEPMISVTLSFSTPDELGNFKRQFYNLNLERDAITYLPTMWTIVHKINEESPLFGYSEEDIKNVNAKMYILFQYHEESFSQKVYQIHGYDLSSSLQLNYQFQSAVSFAENGQTILDHSKLSSIEKMTNE